MSNKTSEPHNYCFEYDFDAVQMAVSGTDNYDVSMWWYEATLTVGNHLHPDLEDAFLDVVEYLSNAIYDYHERQNK